MKLKEQIVLSTDGVRIKANKQVWVEVRSGILVRIFRTYRSAVAASRHILVGSIEPQRYGDAVKAVRHTIFVRSGGDCEICASSITESASHLHEQKHRGRGGEISLENSIIICAKCHRRAHPEREVRLGKRREQ